MPVPYATIERRKPGEDVGRFTEPDNEIGELTSPSAPKRRGIGFTANFDEKP